MKRREPEPVAGAGGEIPKKKSGCLGGCCLIPSLLVTAFLVVAFIVMIYQMATGNFK